MRAFLFAMLRNVIGTIRSQGKRNGRSAMTIGLLVLATLTNGTIAAGVARADAAKGSLNDWVDAVCSYKPGRLTADPVPQWRCPGIIRRSANDVSFDTLWVIFQFTHQRTRIRGVIGVRGPRVSHRPRAASNGVTTREQTVTVKVAAK